MPTPPLTSPAATTRSQLRHKRKQLSPSQQHSASLRLSLQLSQLKLVRSAKHIGIYHANAGEISLSKLIKSKPTTRFYSPQIKDENLSFHYQKQFSRGLKKHKWGVLEPCNNRTRLTEQLDVVLMPLVAFTKIGDRMGMGGGFYDRKFSYRNQARIKNHYKKPVLIGIAHDLQHVNALTTQAWDVSCDFIVTDKHCFYSKYLRAISNANKLRLQNTERGKHKLQT